MWVGLKMINLQSWKDQFFEVSSGLTVFEAKSEVGKSVFIKCLRLALNYNVYTPRERASIVRDWDVPGAPPGEFSILTDTKHLVLFTFNLKNIKTTIVYPDKTVRSYMGPADSEVMEIISMVKVNNSDRIMNILDNETPMFLDGTDRTYNNNILGDFILHPELKAMETTAKSHIEYYKDQIRKLTSRSQYEMTQRSLLPKTGDLDYVQNIIPELQELDNKITILEKLDYNLNELKEFNPKKYLENYSDLVNMHTNNFNKAELIRRLIALCDEDKPIIQNLPELNDSLNQIKIKQNLLKILFNIFNTEQLSVFDDRDLRTLAIEIGNHTILFRKLLLISEIEYLPVKSSAELSKIDDEILDINQKSALFKKLIVLYNNLSDIETTQNLLNQSLELQKEFYSILKYCPVCNNKLEVGDHYNET